MKTNGTRILIITIILYFIFVLLSFTSFAQPDYDFSSGSLISGTDKQKGAQYLFTNVRPGVEAIVTITDLTSGLTLANIDGSSGFKEAFQPVINVPAFSKGYAEFQIDFVDSGTQNLKTMLEVPITCIDVDGKINTGGPVYEFDMVQLFPSTYIDYSLLGPQLTVDFLTPGFVTGYNTAAIDYPGVDTMAKQAMFSVVSANISSTIVRVGADNLLDTGSVLRLRSVYFKKFSYPGSFLAQPALQSFRGVEKNQKVELQWTLLRDIRLSKVIIERGNRAGQFNSIAEVSLDNSSVKQSVYHFNDNMAIEGNTFYRLKMIETNGAIQYSNILLFRSGSDNMKSFKIYPTSVQSTATVNIKSERSGAATFQLVDYSGRVMQQQNISVQEGNNTIQLNNLANMQTGSYVAVLKIDNQTYNQKIFKQ